MLQSILHGIFPDGISARVGAVVGAIGFAWEQVAGYNQALPLLITAMALDYVTGILAAAIYKRKYPKSKKGLDSRVGALGILKKLAILCIVVFAHLVDEAIAFDGIEALVTWFYLGNEGLSVIENAAKAGVPVPQKLLDILEQLSEEKDEQKHAENGRK